MKERTIAKDSLTFFPVRQLRYAAMQIPGMKKNRYQQMTVWISIYTMGTHNPHLLGVITHISTGLKPSFFMVLWSKGIYTVCNFRVNSPLDQSKIHRCGHLFIVPSRKLTWLKSPSFLVNIIKMRAFPLLSWSVRSKFSNKETWGCSTTYSEN